MATLDEIFYKEFNQMMMALKGMSGAVSLQDVELPPQADGRFFVETRNKILINGITEEYFEKLNGEDCLLWGSSALRRRKFDYKGNFIRDKAGNYALQDVPCPHDSVAVISKLSIGVPNQFKSKEQSQYVDMITKNTANGKIHRFVYIVPKKYCYPVKQTALVLSWTKLHKFYSGIGLSLTNGHILYLYIIPYKPSNQPKNYRVIHCKTDLDYSQEIEMLRDYWIKRNIMFNPNWCTLTDYVKGRENMAYFNLDGTEDVYERFDVGKSLGEDDTFEEVDFVDE